MITAHAKKTSILSVTTSFSLQSSLVSFQVHVCLQSSVFELFHKKSSMYLNLSQSQLHKFICTAANLAWTANEDQDIREAPGWCWSLYHCILRTKSCATEFRKWLRSGVAVNPAAFNHFRNLNWIARRRCASKLVIFGANCRAMGSVPFPLNFLSKDVRSHDC